MTNGNDQLPPKAAETVGAIKAYFNPIVAIAFSMLLAIVLLIGATALGLDKGLVLAHMGQVEFAGGWFTYLFAVVTFGTAGLLLFSALPSAGTRANGRGFEGAKGFRSRCWAYSAPSSAFILVQKSRPRDSLRKQSSRSRPCV